MNKLTVIQNELKAPKSRRNSFGNYNYRSCEDILEAVKPLLAKHECSLWIEDDVTIVDSWHYVTAKAHFSDGEKEVVTTAHARECEAKKGMDDSQITGTASSYARKYALNALFLIDDTKDADTDEYQKTTREAQKPKAEKNTAVQLEITAVQLEDLKARLRALNINAQAFNGKKFEDMTTDDYKKALDQIAKMKKEAK